MPRRRLALTFCLLLGLPTFAGCTLLTWQRQYAAEPQTLRENAQAGSKDWLLTNASTALTERPNVIKGFASPFSVAPGSSINYYVSSRDPTFSGEIFRLGWYKGLGARSVGSFGPIEGVDQSSQIRVDPTTGLVVANWTASGRILINNSWVPGVYLIKLTTNFGLQNYIPFVVRSATPTGDLLYHTSEFTWEAYNAYGGTSLYVSDRPGSARAYQVTEDRPLEGNGWGDLGRWEIPMIQFIESKGYGVDYASDGDIDADPSLLTHYKGVLTTGHDEYWTVRMRDAFETARDRGVNLAFFGANIAHWVIRLEPSHLDPAVKGRVITCYKSAKDDPIRFTSSPNQTTSRFRAQPINRPESDLIGVQLNLASANSGTYGNMTFTANVSTVFSAGPDDSKAVIGILGTEWDAVPSPPPLVHVKVIAQGIGRSNAGVETLAQSTIYRASSGSYVFAAGTLGWSLGLEPWYGSVPSEPLRQLTREILDVMKGDTTGLRPDVKWV